MTAPGVSDTSPTACFWACPVRHWRKKRRHYSTLTYGVMEWLAGPYNAKTKLNCEYRLVRALKNPKSHQSTMSKKFLRDRPWTFAHVFNVPLPSLLRMFFFFFFRQIFGFWYLWDIWVLRDPTFPAKMKQNKTKHSWKAQQGHITHVRNFSGSIPQKRRGHVDLCARKVQKSRLGIVISWF